MTTTAATTAHERYLRHSPYYAHLTETYGRHVNRSQAESIAAIHGSELDDLELTWASDGELTVSVLELVQELGY